MKEYFKNIIRIFLKIDNDVDFLEDSLETEQKIEINLIYILGIISFIGLGFYLYNFNFFDINLNIKNIGHLKELDNDGILLYKLSAELSKSCTVRSWDVIHKVLKDLDQESVNILELIFELEKLKKLNSILPGDFSTNQNSFEKSLIKLINFLKEFL